MITPNDALQFIKDHHNGEIPYTFGKNEYARWMAEFANHTVTKHLHKLGVVRGGDSETFTVQGAEIFISGMEVKVTPCTPTEPLPVEALALTVCDGCGIKWKDLVVEGKSIECSECGKEIRG